MSLGGGWQLPVIPPSMALLRETESGAETGPITNAGLKTQPVPIVAIELKLDGFDVAHKGLIGLYVFSNS